MSNEDIRQRAAIAVLPECVRETHEVLSNGGKLIEETQAKQAAMMAVAYADALAEKLKEDEQETESKFNAEKIVKVLKEQVGFDPEIHKIIDEHFDEMYGEEPVNLSNLEQNGKNCKPANFAKSSKDLQELTEPNRILAEDLLLTDFGKEVEDMVLYISKHPNGLIGGVKGYSFRKIPSLYSLAVKQFKQDQMNQEFATFTRQEFNEAVDEEIKRRCEGIDVDKIVKDYRCFGLSYDPEQTEFERLISIYRQGVIDTIKKLKTK